MPYADRIDRQKTRTINFYCHQSKSANRKLCGDSGFQGCGFRVMYKLKCPSEIGKDDLVYQIFKIHDMHNHPLEL